MNGVPETTIGTALVDASGNWQLVSTVPLPEGTIALAATQTDVAGNPAVGVGAIEVDSGLLDAPTVVSVVTNDTSPTVTGTATVNTSSGETLSVAVNGREYVLGVDDPLQYNSVTNTWTLALAAMTLTDGSFPVVATATNGSGSTTGHGTLVIDTSPPATPTINDLATSRSTPTITGTAVVLANEILRVSLNGVVYTAGSANLTLEGSD